MKDSEPSFGEDGEAMLAAFRRAEQIPAEVRTRVWADLRTRIDPSRARRRLAAIAVGIVVALAAGFVLLLRSGWNRLDGENETHQAVHETQVEPIGGHAFDRSSNQSIDPNSTAAPHVIEGTSSHAAPAELAPVPVPRRNPDRRTVDTTKTNEPRDSPTRSSTSLTEELALIERARQALLDGAPKQAAHALAEHERRFQSGVLVEERRGLAAIARCQSNGDASGRSLAESFLRDHPTAALAQRVRQACGLEPTP